MRVFVLCTGRCGSVTFIEACQHIDNYTAGHETRFREYGPARFDYPDGHIEADNRLSWFLGGLGRAFGADPLYVHLRRDPEQVARSFVGRWNKGRANIMGAFGQAVIPGPFPRPEEQRLDVARFYVDTVRTNIEAFLATVPNTMTVDLEHAPEQFPEFWRRIGAEGDLDAALGEFEHRHNAAPAAG
ncbi:hypothetical protein CLV30_10813 [Haloactinopolyspora alba]|uniref:Sulfotransferase family protein n=1 Tax=Haloactinopolyspora alba TaxID=648780 RepID=A0A2P8E0V4_9ACTN|nr:hypothetical protein CLV30_10813 [Haloactinopolyspora alba]